MVTTFPPRLSADQKAERARRQALDGEAARAEYRAQAAHEDDKIVRLRAARLERDRLAAEASPGPAAKPAKKAGKKTVRRNIPLG